MTKRETVMENVLDGDELILFKQKRMMSHLEGILWDLSLMPYKNCSEVMQDIIGVMFPDGNRLEFNLHLFDAIKGKINSILSSNPDADIEAVRSLLCDLKKCAKEYDNIAFVKQGVYKYTAPWFDHIEEDTRKWYGSESDNTRMRDFKEYLLRPQFDGMRDSELFKALSDD